MPQKIAQVPSVPLSVLGKSRGLVTQFHPLTAEITLALIVVSLAQLIRKIGDKRIFKSLHF